MKKFICILTIFVLFASLFACSNKSSDNLKNHNITFPANDIGKTEFNNSIYEIEPFKLSIDFPDSWTLKESEPINFPFTTVWSKLDIFDKNGELVGVIGYNTYELYEEAEDNPQAIYNQIALGNNYHFDVRESYKVLNEVDTGITALCDVYYSASINDGTEKINKGIISYNKDFLVYIALELTNESASDNELTAIAKSIKFSK